MDTISNSRMPRLPLEIILEVINSFFWADDKAILAPCHETTKTLLALARVCRSIRPIASELLYRHCVYIDSEERLMKLCQTVLLPTQDSTAPSKNIAKLFLSPFTGAAKSVSANNVSAEATATQRDDASDSSTPSPPIDSPLDDLSTATAVRDLLTAVAPTLRSLVIDMPLRSLYPEDDHNGVRPILRAAFSALTGLENFVSVRDELFLNTTEARDEPEVWATLWPKLQCLALYNLDLGAEGIWNQLANLPCLQAAVFGRADGYGEDIDHEEDDAWHALLGLDVKKEWLQAMDLTNIYGGVERVRTMALIFADVADLQPRFGKYAESWQTLDPDSNIQILLADVPEPGRVHADAVGEDETCPIELTQQFLLRHGLDGTLWDKTASWIRKDA